MGAYRARGNEDNIEHNTESTQNALKVGLEVAEHIPVANMYAKAAKGIDKLTGGQLTKNAAKVFNKGLENSPMGSHVQNAINSANDSGLTNTVGNAASLKNGGGNGSKLTGLKTGINKATSTNGDLIGNMWAKMPPALKLKIAVGCGVALLFLLMVTTIFAADDNHNLSLTNGTSISGTNIGKRKCSAEEIENKLLYVGDSRTVGMQSSLENQNINYIAESGKGYDWFNSTALANIEAKIQEKSDAVIVLGLGVNDLYNIDNYITAYKSLISKYPSTQFYVLSVNPVDETKAVSNGYTVTNADIEAFNKKLADNFPNNYIDSYSSLTSIGTNDGVHYDNETYKSLNSLITSNISGSGKVMCGASGNLAASLEEVANWYIQNVAKYDQTLYVESPFSTSKVRADCSGFAVAYMSYVSGTDVPISHSGEMVDPNGSWAQSVSQLGWKAYSSDTVGTLQTGDILISHAGSLYSTKGRHAEIYVDESSTFGWGSVKTQYPTSKVLQTSNFGGHVHFMDSTHDYITIYRYEG